MTLIQFEKMNRVVPNPMQYSKGDEDAKKPKSVILVPMNQMMVAPSGFYIFTVEQSSLKTSLWLVFVLFLVMFFLLFRVWPEWLRLGVWYISWYLLVFLVSTAPSKSSQSKDLTFMFLLRSPQPLSELLSGSSSGMLESSSGYSLTTSATL